MTERTSVAPLMALESQFQALFIYLQNILPDDYWKNLILLLFPVLIDRIPGVEAEGKLGVNLSNHLHGRQIRCKIKKDSTTFPICNSLLSILKKQTNIDSVLQRCSVKCDLIENTARAESIPSFLHHTASLMELV